MEGVMAAKKYEREIELWNKNPQDMTPEELCQELINCGEKLKIIRLDRPITTISEHVNGRIKSVTEEVLRRMHNGYWPKFYE